VQDTGAQYTHDKPGSLTCPVYSFDTHIFPAKNQYISPFCYCVSPHEMGRHIVFSFDVCLSVRHAFVSALCLLNPWWDLQITLHKCQVWWGNVQCLCLTKVGSRSRSQSKIKHCMTVFGVRSISFEPLMGFTNTFAQMSAMLRWCAVPMLDQGCFKVKVRIED